MSDVLDAMRWLAGMGGLVRFGCEDEESFVRASLRLDGDPDRLIVAKVTYGAEQDPLAAVLMAIGEIKAEGQARLARARLRPV